MKKQLVSKPGASVTCSEVRIKANARHSRLSAGVPAGFDRHRSNHNDFNRDGNLLIADSYNNRVIETNQRGEIVWHYGLGPADTSANSPIGVTDAQRLHDGLTLTTNRGLPPGAVPAYPSGVVDSGVVTLVDRNGHIVLSYATVGTDGSAANQLYQPTTARFVPRRLSYKPCNDDRTFRLRVARYFVADSGKRPSH